MGLIGFFGNEQFEVSSNSVYTLNTDIQITTEPILQTLNRIGSVGGAGKPLIEYISAGLDTITFSITVSAMLGVNPRAKLDFWRSLAASGVPDVLVIGNVPVGTDEWIVTNVVEDWTTLDANGNVIKGTIAITMKEYITNVLKGY
jgi:phage protein U